MNTFYSETNNRNNNWSWKSLSDMADLPQKTQEHVKTVYATLAGNFFLNFFRFIIISNFWSFITN
jgi:hypothetical protein